MFRPNRETFDEWKRSKTLETLQPLFEVLRRFCAALDTDCSMAKQPPLDHDEVARRLSEKFGAITSISQLAKFHSWRFWIGLLEAQSSYYQCFVLAKCCFYMALFGEEVFLNKKDDWHDLPQLIQELCSFFDNFHTMPEHQADPMAPPGKMLCLTDARNVVIEAVNDAMGAFHNESYELLDFRLRVNGVQCLLKFYSVLASEVGTAYDFEFRFRIGLPAVVLECAAKEFSEDCLTIEHREIENPFTPTYRLRGFRSHAPLTLDLAKAMPHILPKLHSLTMVMPWKQDGFVFLLQCLANPKLTAGLKNLTLGDFPLEIVADSAKAQVLLSRVFERKPANLANIRLECGECERPLLPARTVSATKYTGSKYAFKAVAAGLRRRPDRTTHISLCRFPIERGAEGLQAIAENKSLASLIHTKSWIPCNKGQSPESKDRVWRLSLSECEFESYEDYFGIWQGVYQAGCVETAALELPQSDVSLYNNVVLAAVWRLPMLKRLTLHDASTTRIIEATFPLSNLLGHGQLEHLEVQGFYSICPELFFDSLSWNKSLVHLHLINTVTRPLSKHTTTAMLLKDVFQEKEKTEVSPINTTLEHVLLQGPMLHWAEHKEDKYTNYLKQVESYSALATVTYKVAMNYYNRRCRQACSNYFPVLLSDVKPFHSSVATTRGLEHVFAGLFSSSYGDFETILNLRCLWCDDTKPDYQILSVRYGMLRAFPSLWVRGLAVNNQKAPPKSKNTPIST